MPDVTLHPSEARLAGMARLILRADREDADWADELVRSTKRLASEHRRRLQQKINVSEPA
jgi:hypothetical protein